MNEPETIPKWRIVMWGIVAAVGVDAIIYYFRNIPGAGPKSPLEYLGGPFSGAFICGFGFLLVSARAGRDKMMRNRDSLNQGSAPMDEDRTSQKGLLVLRVLFSLLAALFFFIAGTGIYDGHISSAGRHYHREIYAAHDPVFFWMSVAFYIGIGIYLLYVVFRKPRK